MSKFTPILLDGHLDKSSFKKWTYTPYVSNAKVYTPFDGIVFGVDESNGLVKIKHTSDFSGYISKISGLDNIKVSKGQKVTKGEVIGKTSDNSITLEITDTHSLDQLISPFFIGSIRTTPTKETKPENKKVELPKKSYTDNSKQDKLLTLKDKKPKTSYTTSKYNDEKTSSFSALDIGLLPLHLFNAGWRWLTKKKEKDDEESLQEEIIRIKQLLK